MNAKLLPKMLLSVLILIASAFAMDLSLTLNAPVLAQGQNIIVVPSNGIIWANAHGQAQFVQNICDYWIYLDGREIQHVNIGWCWSGSQVTATQRIDASAIGSGRHQVTFRVSGMFWYDVSTPAFFLVNSRPMVNTTHSGDKVGKVDFNVEAHDDGVITEYAYDFDNDGKFDEITTQPHASHYFDTPGNHTIRIRVTDNYGESTIVSHSFTLLDMPKTIYENTDFDFKFSDPHAYYTGYVFRTSADSTAALNIITKSSSSTDPIDRFELTSDKSIQTFSNFTTEDGNFVFYRFPTTPKICKSWYKDGIFNRVCPPDNSYALTAANDIRQVAALDGLYLGTRPYTVASNFSLFLNRIEQTAAGAGTQYKVVFNLGTEYGTEISTTVNTSNTAPSPYNPLRTRLQYTSVNGTVLDCFVQITGTDNVRIGEPRPVTVGVTEGMTCNLDAAILYYVPGTKQQVHDEGLVTYGTSVLTLSAIGQKADASGTVFVANLKATNGQRTETAEVILGGRHVFFGDDSQIAFAVDVNEIIYGSSGGSYAMLRFSSDFETHVLTLTAVTKSGKRYSKTKDMIIDWGAPSAILVDHIYKPDPAAVAKSDAIRKAAWDKKVQRLEKAQHYQ